MSVGTPEILVILLVALLVFGPHRLPDVARQVGSAMRELRKIQDTVRGELDMVLHPEHGTRSHDGPDEPGDHSGDGFIDGTYVDERYVDHEYEDPQLEDDQFVRGDHAGDFSPPDALSPADLDAARRADEERRFLGPPDSFI